MSLLPLSNFRVSFVAVESLKYTRGVMALLMTSAVIRPLLFFADRSRFRSVSIILPTVAIEIVTNANVTETKIFTPNERGRFCSFGLVSSSGTGLASPFGFLYKFAVCVYC